jgi:hypothetical protein
VLRRALHRPPLQPITEADAQKLAVELEGIGFFNQTLPTS